MAQQQYVSFYPGDFVRGGLISNVDVETISARFTPWNYEGKGAEVLALIMEVREEGQQEITEQAWSLGAGALADFVVSSDGFSLSPKGSKSALNDSTNFAEFMRSLEKAGFPIDKLREGRMDHLLGMKWHLIRVDTNRANMPPPTTKKVEGKVDRPQQVVICHKLIWCKFDKKGARRSSAPAPAAGDAAASTAAAVNGSPSTASATAAATAATTGEAGQIPDSIKAVAIAAVEKVLAGQPTVTSATLRKELFVATAGEAMEIRQACVPLFADAEWLADQGYLATQTSLTRAY